MAGTRNNKCFNMGYEPITNSKNTSYRDMMKNQTPPPGHIKVLKAGEIPIEEKIQGYTGTGGTGTK